MPNRCFEMVERFFVGIGERNVQFWMEMCYSKEYYQVKHVEFFDLVIKLDAVYHVLVTKT